MQLFDLFVSNWPTLKPDSAGASGQLSCFPQKLFPRGVSFVGGGPALGASYRGIPHLMVGFRSNPSPCRYGFSDPQKSEVPADLVHGGCGWYAVKSGLTWTVNSATGVRQDSISWASGVVEFWGPEPPGSLANGRPTPAIPISPMYTVRLA
jgi:hypothetical protein